MHRSLAVLCVLQLTIVLSVEGVSMTISPSSMVVGSSTANIVKPLQLRCSSDGTDKIETVYRLEISRKRSSDSDFVDIAAIDDYEIKTNFPLDMRSPSANGSFMHLAEGKPLSSGTLIVTMDGGSLTCSDQAEFRCTMTYNIKGKVASPVSQSKNFTVITPPNDVRITDALYEEGGYLQQLTNDSTLKMNTRIMYRCKANVGDDSNVTIVWERAWPMGISTNFITYTPTVSTDIVQDPVTPTNCSFSLTSSMYYNLTNRDDYGITFRCKVRAYLCSQWYESTSAHHRTFAVITPDSSSSTFSLPAVAGGIGAGVVVILMAVVALFIWRRYNLRRLQTDDISLEESRNATLSLRPPENDSYETLHHYANNDIQMYSALQIPKMDTDSEKMYENTRIKATDLTAEHQ